MTIRMCWTRSTQLLAAVSDAEILVRLRPGRRSTPSPPSPDDFDLVLTDLEMPGMNGIDFRRHVHAISPSTKILLATGSGLVHGRIRARDRILRAAVQTVFDRRAQTNPGECRAPIFPNFRRSIDLTNQQQNQGKDKNENHNENHARVDSRSARSALIVNAQDAGGPPPGGNRPFRQGGPGEVPVAPVACRPRR